MKLIPRLIIWLTKIEEKHIETISGNKNVKNIFCHRGESGAVHGLLFRNADEPFNDLTILRAEQSVHDAFVDHDTGNLIRGGVIRYLRQEATRDTGEQYNEKNIVGMLRACADYLEQTAQR